QAKRPETIHSVLSAFLQHMTPPDEQAIIRLVQLLQQYGQRKIAIAFLRHVCQRYPAFRKLPAMLLNIVEEESRSELARNPQSISAMINLAVVSIQRGRYHEARTLLSRARRLATDPSVCRRIERLRSQLDANKK
ncbi:MAG: hypothetical protein D6820_15370, partial [Lentisphaerae bacterium]